MTNRAFKTGESREQGRLLPPRIEDYVWPDNAVRAIESFVGALDLAKLGFRHADRAADEMGQPLYDPADLLKPYLYGCTNQIRSSHALPVSRRHSLAGSAGTLRRSDKASHAIFPLGREWRVEKGVRDSGGRCGQ